MRKEVLDTLNRISAERIAELTLALVKIPSPSGNETAATAFLDQYLGDIGMEVQIEDTYPESPSLIAYLRGKGDGRTLQLDGHIDTVSTPHPPGEIKSGRVYGRGASDMKGNIAAMVEAARVLVESGTELNGTLMLTIHGQHEDAVGDNPMHAPLFALFDKKIFGDAAIVCEGPHDGLVIAAKGMSFWEIDITRQGDPVHEVISGGANNPLWAAYKVLQALETKAEQWTLSPDPDVGSQTFFVGQINGGDYYNRVPTHVHMKGTRRTIPGVDFETMEHEFQALVDKVAQEDDVDITLKLLRSGQSYRLSPDEPVVTAVRDAYQTVTGIPMPLVGLRYTGNASQFNNIAGVPTVYYGADQHRAHANPEWVEIKNLEKAAKVYLLSTLYYLDLEPQDQEGTNNV